METRAAPLLLLFLTPCNVCYWQMYSLLVEAWQGETAPVHMTILHQIESAVLPLFV